MRSENDNLLSRLTVKLRMPGIGPTLGTGIIYHGQELNGKLYILTAAHVLFADGDKFQDPIGTIQVDFYSNSTQQYKSIQVESSQQLFFSDQDKDVAVLVFSKSEVEAITDKLPPVYAVSDRQRVTNFFLKGFPNATQGAELDAIHPVWKQAMTEVKKFQLTLQEDYSEWSTGGFSGSGIFLHDYDLVYLFGIFTRFRKQELGKVIYAQYLETFNELLSANYLPPIRFAFLGQHGLTREFFTRQVQSAIKNLGPRFNSELNFRMPVAKLFNDLAKDEFFKKRILESLHHWLLKAGDRKYFQSYQQLSEVAAEHVKTVEEIRQFVAGIDWSPLVAIDLDQVLEKIRSLGKNSYAKMLDLFSLQRELLTKNPQKDPYSAKPLDQEIRLLRDLDKYNDTLETNLAHVDVNLANHPVLLIQGEAGCGKSHLLGDIASRSIVTGNPVLLLLGQQFKSDRSIWENITAQIGLSLGKDELLVSLNEIGKQIGSRVLILIDALNEGAGKNLWPNELAGFIAEIYKYPFIGLAMTVRTTYWASVVPHGVRTDEDIYKHTHQGFKGNEYQALKLFCEHYSLAQPNFPILSPEFTNPLFLQLVCEGLKSAGEKNFPQGFQGFSKVFNYYLKAVQQKLTDRCEAYALKTKIAESAISLVAHETFKREERMLSLEDAVALFEQHHPASPSLLMDLIQEGIFIRTMRPTLDKDEQEFVYFAYERFGDFIIAKTFLDPFQNAQETLAGFNRGTALGELIKENYANNGLLETLAILLPEKVGLEITEVYDWFLSSGDPEVKYKRDYFHDWLMGSLKWRSAASVKEQKVIAWLQSDHSNENLDQYYNRVIELAAVKDHPFNSDRLHRILGQYSMADRDGHFQQFLMYYNGSGDNEPFPLSRLLDWAWQPGISAALDYETVRLVAQTLAWVLSSTLRKLRDRATKALVNLLEEQPAALIYLLNAFKDIDDAYITERLYAVAYGCILRTTSLEAVQTIAQTVYDQVFSRENPPPHVLLRDYARNTVEYGLHRHANIVVNPLLIRPPYKSEWPEHLPTKEEVAVFHKDGDGAEINTEKVRIFNRIHFDAMTWDFARKVIDYKFSDFLPQRFTIGLEYKNFLKTLPIKKRTTVKAYLDMYALCFQVKEVIRISSRMSEDRLKQRQDFLVMGEEMMADEKFNIENHLDQHQMDYVKRVIIPYLEDGARQDAGNKSDFPVARIKAWVVKRAHELGYDIEKHYNFDSIAENYKNSRYASSVDRIGQKYLWIAFYEIFGLTADHFKMKDRYTSQNKPGFYQGPWQKYLRDVDPVFITRRTDEDDEDQEEESNELGIAVTQDEWWIDQNYTYWNQDNISWVKNSQDLPDPKRIIQRTDESGVQWLYLGAYANWDEPVPFGEDKYSHVRKDIWYMFTAYLVKKRDKKKAIKWLSEQDFGGRWLPEPNQVIGLFNRENYWSPYAKAEARGKSHWITIQDSRVKVILTTNEAVGEMSEDKSGAHFNYLMPSKFVLEGMGLKYSAHDGDFMNDRNEIVVLNNNPKGMMVRKEDFLRFLDTNGYEVVWTLLGEKSANGSHIRESYRTTVSGVYALETDGQVNGNFKINDIH